jgi:hypothetical protein
MSVSLTKMEEVLTDSLVDHITDRICHKLAAFLLPKRWVPRGRYAEHHGVTPKTVYLRTPCLRALGAAKGEGKMTRYDITVSPSGERLLKT